MESLDYPERPPSPSPGQTPCTPGTNLTLNPFHPLELDPTTNEPFLRLPPPHTNIILTPPRAGDEDAMHHILNDPRVASGLASVELPYPRERVAAWLNRAREVVDAVVMAVREGGCKGADANEDQIQVRANLPDAVMYASGCPVRAIREVLETSVDEGSGLSVRRDVFLGELAVLRGQFDEVLDPVERAEVERVNRERRAGDPNIRWGVADYISSSHHGRGIMTAAVNAVLNTWMIPRMNAQEVVVFTFVENIASARVFLKNGFTHVGVVDNGMMVRGERTRLNHLVWTQRREELEEE